ncbi:hypothetical protein ACFOHS_16110 [Jhaorihella thermophila]
MLVFILVAVTLGVSVRRFNTLLMTNAALERERANLSRYFFRPTWWRSCRTMTSR